MSDKEKLVKLEALYQDTRFNTWQGLWKIMWICYLNNIQKHGKNDDPCTTDILKRRGNKRLREGSHNTVDILSVQFNSVAQLCLTLCDPQTAKHKASMSITNSQSLPKPISIGSVMPSNHIILFRPLLLLPSIFPASGSFPMSQFFTSGGQSIGASALASVFPMNIQDWFPLGLPVLISLQSTELSRVFSNTTV